MSTVLHTSRYGILNPRFLAIRYDFGASIRRAFSDEPEIVPEKKFRKIIKLRDKRPIIQKQRTMNAFHEAKALEMGLSWRIVSAR